jgi:hypothetical protein
MTIYSIMPMETIFAGAETQTYDYVEITLNGVPMQVEMIGGNQAKIVRLLSCRPNDYLVEAYLPGSIIRFQPVVTTYIAP